MIRDYAKRRPALARPRPAGGRSGGGGGWSGGGTSPRAIGMVLAALVMIALVAALGVAWAVRSGSDELARQQGKNEELVKQNQELSDQRDQLFSRERIEEEAAKLELFPPAAGQVREL